MNGSFPRDTEAKLDMTIHSPRRDRTGRTKTRILGYLAITAIISLTLLYPAVPVQVVTGICWAQETEQEAISGVGEAEVSTPTEEAEPPMAILKGPKPYPLVSNVFFDTDIRQALSDCPCSFGSTHCSRYRNR